MIVTVKKEFWKLPDEQNVGVCANMYKYAGKKIDVVEIGGKWRDRNDLWWWSKNFLIFKEFENEE